MRIFFAIDLPHKIKTHFAAIMTDWQKKLPQNALHWSKPENLHITLQFLTQINANDLEKISRSVHATLQAFPAFQLQLGRLELFPASTHPQFLSVQVGPHDTLTNLAQTIGRGIIAANYPIEPRPFRGHLTLGKFHLTPPNFSLQNMALHPLEKILITKITLFESKPSHEQSLYTALDHFVLPTRR